IAHLRAAPADSAILAVRFIAHLRAAPMCLGAFVLLGHDYLQVRQFLLGFAEHLQHTLARLAA
ncbi:hypothetical protein PA598K_02423, partial [Paenibacillus sp. 598K]